MHNVGHTTSSAYRITSNMNSKHSIRQILRNKEKHEQHTAQVSEESEVEIYI